jgi:diguanylate cyclase (GGDEF)-like protein
MRNPIPLALALALVSTGLQLAALFPEQTPNYWQLLVLIGLVGQLLAVMVVFSARRMRRAFAAVVQTDPLTQIGNRRRLDQILSSARDLTVIFIDLDHFGRINTTHGHLVGDQMLCAAAGSLAKLAPGTVCRYGGEEFAVLVRGITFEEGGMIAEAIRTAFAEAGIGSEYGAPLTLTAGVAVQSERETGEQTLGRADAALLRAKKAGRNCTFLHDGAGVQAVGPSD